MNREVEDGMGFSGLVPTREEREIDRLSSELATSEASCDRLRSSYDDIRALNVQIIINCATERAAKDARIAELSDDYMRRHNDAVNHLERAIIGEARADKADAERDAMRKLVARFLEFTESVNEAAFPPGMEDLEKEARAALNPSPAAFDIGTQKAVDYDLEAPK